VGPLRLGPHRPAAQEVLGELVVLVEDDGPHTGEAVVDVQQLGVAVEGRQGDVVIGQRAAEQQPGGQRAQRLGRVQRPGQVAQLGAVDRGLDPARRGPL
jgi:hypothetical protein